MYTYFRLSKFLLLAFFFLLFIGRPAWSQTEIARDSALAMQQLKAASALRDSAKWEQAELAFAAMREQYEHLLKRVPDQSRVIWAQYLNGLDRNANTFHRQGKYRQCAEVYQKAIVVGEQLLPNFADLLVILYQNQGANFKELGRFDAALASYDQALQLEEAQVEPNPTVLANLFNHYGTLYTKRGDYQKGKIYHKRALNFRIRDTTQQAALAESYLNLGTVHGIMRELDQAKHYFEAALRINRKLLGETHAQLVMPYSNLGTVHKNLLDFQQALAYYDQALQIQRIHHLENHPRTAQIYANLGNVYNSSGDYSQALDYYEKAISLIRKTLGENHPLAVQAYNNIGTVYQSQDEHEQAIFYEEKALKIAQQVLGEKHHYLPSIKINLGVNHSKLGNEDRALYYVKEGLAQLEQSLGAEHPEVGHAYQVLGRTLMVLGREPEALLWLQKGHEISEKSLSSHHPVLGNSYYSIGLVYDSLGQPDRAEQYYRQSMQCLNPSHSDTRLPLDWPEGLLNSHQLVQTMRAWAGLSLRQNQLEQADTLYQATIKLVEQLRQGYQVEKSRLLLQEEALPIFEGALQTQFALYQRHGDKQYLTRAFHLAEQSKATLLQQAWRESEARQYAGIPQSLQLEERELRRALAYNEKRLYEAMARKVPTDSALLPLRDTLFQIRQRYLGFKSKLEQKYPIYYQWKYRPLLPKIAELKQQLGEDQALVEYMVGDESLFVFYLSPTRFEGMQLPLPLDLESSVQALRQSVYQPFTQSNRDADAGAEEFARQAHALYRALIEPIEAVGLPSRITFIPDGILGNLPFDVLLKQAPARAPAWRDHPYLFLHHQISYVYSAGLWLQAQKKAPSPAHYPLLALAPDFGDENQTLSLLATRRGVGPLAFNVPEARAVQQIMGGKLLINRAATEANFLQFAPYSRLIHISTHAKIHDNNPLYSQIYFQPDSGSHHDGILEVAELFTLSLPAEMVVLSACETGVGQLQRGEGVMSLARGISYAGARSIITSLWQVNDAATAEIMTRFYEALAEGKDKDEALYVAKRTYFEAHDEVQAHPFFWAGFIPIGDMRPLSPPPFREGHWWVLALVILVGGITYGIWKKQNRST